MWDALATTFFSAFAAPVGDSALLVLPVPAFALGNPLDRCINATRAGVFAFRFGDPLRVLPFVTGREFLKGSGRFLVCVERFLKLGRHDEFVRRFLFRAGLLGPSFVQPSSLPEVTLESAVGRKIGQLRNSAELPR